MLEDKTIRHDKIRVGKHNWLILDKQDGKTLIITEKIIEKREYHQEVGKITWETSDIRRYLNGKFYESFNEADRVQIIEVRNENPENPWDGTDGGNATTDNVFLLNIDEIIKYFGDSGQLTANPTGPKGESWWFNDQYNADRSAKFGSKNAWWWLRSPGYINCRAAYIAKNGNIHLHGEPVKSRNGGVRPALWLKDGDD